MMKGIVPVFLGSIVDTGIVAADRGIQALVSRVLVGAERETC